MRIDAPPPSSSPTRLIVQFHMRPVSSLDLRLFQSGGTKITLLRASASERRGGGERKKGDGRKSAWKRGRHQRATQSDGLPWDKKLPCPGITRREASLREEFNDSALYELGDEVDPPGITLFQLSTEARHRGGLFIAHDKDLVNYLLPIYNILFATVGCCATAGRDECGFTRWWLWRRKEEREKKNGRTRVIV